jgi:hypothetical protein
MCKFLLGTACNKQTITPSFREFSLSLWLHGQNIQCPGTYTNFFALCWYQLNKHSACIHKNIFNWFAKFVSSSFGHTVWRSWINTYPTNKWHLLGARGSVVGWGAMLQAERSRVRVLIRWIFFNLPNPSSRNMALGSIQPITEMSTRNLPGGKGQPVCKADNLTAICELIV